MGAEKTAVELRQVERQWTEKRVGELMRVERQRGEERGES